MIPDTIITAAIELIRKSGEEHYLPVSGVSMRPFLHDGDMVLVTPFLDPLESGDIIVYQTSRVLITHRLLHINHNVTEGTTYTTKGDNSIAPDPPVNFGQIIGKVIAIRRSKREMRLDTPLWTKSNHLIGSLMVGIVKLSSKRYESRRVEPGEKLDYFSRVFRRGMLTISSLVVQLLSGVAGRWIMIEPREG